MARIVDRSLVRDNLDQWQEASRRPRYVVAEHRQDRGKDTAFKPGTREVDRAARLLVGTGKIEFQPIAGLRHCEADAIERVGISVVVDKAFRHPAAVWPRRQPPRERRLHEIEDAGLRRQDGREAILLDHLTNALPRTVDRGD